MAGREWLHCGYVTGWPCRNLFKVETYPPELVPIGPCCWPNLRIFVYRILGDGRASLWKDNPIIENRNQVRYLPLA